MRITKSLLIIKIKDRNLFLLLEIHLKSKLKINQIYKLKIKKLWMQLQNKKSTRKNIIKIMDRIQLFQNHRKLL